MAGLESGGPQLGRIDPSSLIGRADTEVVSPRATAALADAFRQGFVTVDDIMERVGQRAQLKKKADIMALEEATSPEAQDARRLQLSLARNKMQMGLDLLPHEKEAIETELTGKRQAAEIESAGATEIRAALKAAGYATPLQNGKYTEKVQVEDFRRLGVLREFNQAQAQNNAFIQQGQKSTTLKQVSPTEWQGAIEYGAKVYPASKYQEAVDFQRKMQHPAIWEQSGKPQSPIFGGAPGQVEAPAAPAPASAPGTASPAAGQGQQGQGAVASAPGSTALAPGSSQPIINVNLGGQPLSQLKPDVMAKASPTAPVVPVTSPEPIVQPAGPLGVTPEGTFRVAPELAAKAATAKPLTEVQTRAFQEAVRAAESSPVFDALAAKGFDPSKLGPSVRMALGGETEGRRAILGALQGAASAILPEKFTPQIRLTPDEQQYVSARESWLTGVLRKESGAAIGEQERSRYIVQFFPVEGDTKAVQEQKAVRRKAVELAARAVVHDKTMTPAEYETLWSTIGTQSAQQLQKSGAAQTVGATSVPSFNSIPEALNSGAKEFWVGGKHYSR